MKKIILALLLLVFTFQSKSQDTTKTYVDRLVEMNSSEIYEYIVSVASTKDDPNTNTNEFVKTMDSKFTYYPWYFDDVGVCNLNLEDSIKLVMSFDFSDKSKFKEVRFALEGYENLPPRINQIKCTWIINESAGTYTQAYTIKTDGTNYEKVLSYDLKNTSTNGLRNSLNKDSFKVCVLLELKDENGFVKDITKCKRVYYYSLY